MEDSAQASWEGTLRKGKGRIATRDASLGGPEYSYSTRFEQATGTNPEQLLSAALASCYTMALTFELEKNGLKNEGVNADATAILGREGEQLDIIRLKLKTYARVPDITPQRFEEIAQAAKEHCPMARALKAPVELETILVHGEEPQQVSGITVSKDPDQRPEDVAAG